MDQKPRIELFKATSIRSEVAESHTLGRRFQHACELGRSEKRTVTMTKLCTYESTCLHRVRPGSPGVINGCLFVTSLGLCMGHNLR